jgi:NADH-quinone oxidoreductase subunit C
MKELFGRLEAHFQISSKKVQKYNLAFCEIDSSQAASLVTHLRDFEGFGHLVFLTAVDLLEEGQFELVYMLHNYQSGKDLGIRTRLDRKKAVIQSIHHLWGQAATYQRELKEMFGIEFPESPGLNEPFALEGWHEIPPMRRDFDTIKYSEKTFYPRPGRKSYDPAEHMEKELG